SNHTLDYDFENKLAKSLNENRLITNIISCNPGDYGVDIIASFNHQIVLIQCKNVEKSIGSSKLQKIESAFGRFGKDVLEIIIYNSEKLKNSLTKQANSWWKSCCPEIKIMNEHEIICFFKNKQKKIGKKTVEYLNSHVDECFFSDIVMKGFKAEN
ncbi:34388_t:CDS:1, partial [Gigaspora margarita]